MAQKIIDYHVAGSSYECLNHSLGRGYCLVGVVSNHDRGVGQTEFIAVENRFHKILNLLSGSKKVIYLIKLAASAASNPPPPEHLEPLTPSSYLCPKSSVLSPLQNPSTCLGK